MSNAGAVARLWPKDRHPKLRRMMSRFYREVRSNLDVARFRLWQFSSKVRHGQKRWIEVYGRERILVNANDFRGFKIFSTGGTQKEKVFLWRTFLNFAPEIVIDVGANYGEFSAAAAATGVRGIAIEANPNVAACLNETLKSYPNYRLKNMAASDREGRLQFFFNGSASGSGSMSSELPASEFGSLRVGRVEAVDIPCGTLDRIVREEFGELPSSIVMKVDVEGFELSVLTGATELLRSVSWWRGIIEFSPQALREAEQDAQKLWNELRNWSGFILTDAADSSNLRVWDGSEPRLPEHPPEYECDVVVGAGIVR